MDITRVLDIWCWIIVVLYSITYFFVLLFFLGLICGGFIDTKKRKQYEKWLESKEQKATSVITIDSLTASNYLKSSIRSENNSNKNI